jgi:hypothetical protein
MRLSPERHLKTKPSIAPEDEAAHLMIAKDQLHLGQDLQLWLNTGESDLARADHGQLHIHQDEGRRGWTGADMATRISDVSPVSGHDNLLKKSPN